MQTAGRADYILFAGHGIYNEKQPDLSGIVFSPEEEQQQDRSLTTKQTYNQEGQGQNVREPKEVPSKKYPNVLTLLDVYQLNLKARLIVLSACKSGMWCFE